MDCTKVGSALRWTLFGLISLKLFHITYVQVLGSLSATRFLLYCLEGWCWWCRH